MSKQLTGRVNHVLGKTVFLNIGEELSLFVPSRRFKQCPAKMDIVTFEVDEMKQPVSGEGDVLEYLIGRNFKHVSTKTPSSDWEVDDSWEDVEAPFEVE